jgi:hypothetical protein
MLETGVEVVPRVSVPRPATAVLVSVLLNVTEELEEPVLYTVIVNESVVSMQHG